MKYWNLIPIVLAIIGVCLIGNALISGYDHVTKTIPESNCEELLQMIQGDGTKPNYQYDVREWIAKECWK